MSRKILTSLILTLIFAVALTLCISASTIYRDGNGNQLFSFEADSNGVITSYEGEFPKIDIEGNALTWYVTATSTEGNNTIKTVASVLTLDENHFSLNNGVYTYKGNTVKNTNVVSVYFPSDKGITKLNISNGGYRSGNMYTYTPNGSEILFVYLPSSLTELPERIVQASKALVCDIPFECQFEKIAQVTFHHAKSLREINIPDSVKEIAGHSSNNGAAFYECVSLERVNIRETSKLEKIGTLAFHNNHKLSYIKIPDSVTYIGEHAFSYTALVESPFSENSRCEHLGGRCFGNISTLKSFIVPATLKTADILGSQDWGPLAESTVDLVTFGNASPVTQFLPSFFARATIKKLVLPEGPTAIPRMFFACANLTELCLPNTIEVAYERALQSAYVEIIRLGANFKYFANNYVDNHSFTNGTKGVREIYLPASFYAEKPDAVYHIGHALVLDGSGSSNIKFFYTGTSEQLAVSLDNFQNTTTASGTNNWKFSGATPVSYADYLADESAYANGYYIIYDYDPCEAFCHPFYNENTVLETTIAYKNYFDFGTKAILCPLCNTVGKGESTAPLFSWRGYSCTESKLGGSYSVTQSFYINKIAISEYEAVTDKKIEFGAFVSCNKNDGSVSLSLDAKGSYSKRLDVLSTDYIEVKVSGITTDAHKSARLIFCLYVIDEGVKFLDNEKTVTELYGISYNEIIK